MPEWNDEIRTRLAPLNLAGPREAEIIEELAQHLDDRYRELLTGGLDEEQARRLALEELAGSEVLAAELRKTRLPAVHEPAGVGSAGGGNLLESIWHDWKVALRILWTKPAFSAMVIGMLALGVAANAAIFSIFDGLFLRPLPFSDPERLVALDETAPKWNLKFVGISNPDFDAWRKGNATFDGMAFFNWNGANLSDNSGVAQRVKAAFVTRDLLSVLGLKPELGRDFRPEEDRPGGAKVVLLGYNLWQRLFQGDRNILGRVLKLDGQPCTVIGVLPQNAVLPPDTEAWAPLAADPKNSGSYYLQGVGRLKRGVTLDRARADLLRVHRSMVQGASMKVNEITSPVVMPLRDRYLGDYRTVTRILLGAVGVVLLIACVNIAGLMMVRGESRTREIAIRTAIGASRVRIVRQLLTESFLVAGFGGVLGVLLGKLCLRGLVALMPEDIPDWVRFNMDGRFALFCVAITGAAAVLFGLAPALQAVAADTHANLQEASRSSLSRKKRGILSALVVCEIALALVLLISSGLLVQAFRKVLRVDPGFRPENVITWNLRPAEAKYPKPGQQRALYDGLIDRLKVLPGVRSVSAVSLVPLDGHTGTFFDVEGHTLGPNEKNPVVLDLTAMPGYFEAMGITFVAGRPFTAQDNDAKSPKVVVINESFAKQVMPGLDPIGRRIRYNGAKVWMQVIGVTRDTKHYGLDEEMKPCVIAPFSLHPRSGMALVVRSSTDPRGLVAPARDIIRQLDRDLPMFDVLTMTERLDRSLWVRRTYSSLFAAFAIVAIILASAGIYGVVSFAVSQRTREIGIRMALGASPGQVMAGVLGNGMVLVSIGVALGLIGSVMAARLLDTLLFGVSTRDPVTYGAVALGVVCVGLLANSVPARRAAGVDPMHALRAE